MASVKRDPRSPFWICCYTLPNGKRKQVSSRLRDKNKALQLALKLEGAGSSVRHGELDKDLATQLIAEIAALGGVRLFDPTPVDEFCKQFIQARKSGWAKRTITMHAAKVQAFLDYLGDRASQPIGTITPALIAGFRDTRLTEGLSPKTVSDTISFLKGIFEDAKQQQRIAANPFDDIKPPRVSGKTKKRPLTWDQFRALVQATDGEWRILILLGGFTGQRQQDVAQLEWSQVDLARRVISFSRAKNDDTHTVPIHPALLDELARWQAQSKGKRKVLPWLSSLPHTTPAGIPHRFRFEILPLIGIEQPYIERGASKARQTSAYSFHSLRHMLSTALNAAGVSAETRMLLVGHEDRKVSANYTHAQFADAAKALEKLPSLQA